MLCVTLSVLTMVFSISTFISAYSTTRSYDLQVPGSTPIRIIEADPIWDDRGHNVRRFQHVDADVDAESPVTDRYSVIEHRTLRTTSTSPSTTQDTKTTLVNPIIQHRNDDDDDGTNVSIENSNTGGRLKAFLEKYAAGQIRTKLQVNTALTEDDAENDRAGEEGLETVELVTRASGLAGQVDIRDKSKAWNLSGQRYAANGFADRKKWVSLDAVPWSVSKIAKWQSNAKPDDASAGYYGTNKWEIDNRNDQYSYSPRPIQSSSSLHRPGSFNHSPNSNSNNKHYGSGNSGGYYSDSASSQSSFQSPNYPQPAAIYGQKVQVDYAPYHQYQHHKNDDCNNNKRPGTTITNTFPSHHHPQSDIITDGLPANFPDSSGSQHNHFSGESPSYNRRRGTDLPYESHPFSGDGEWVLLSTTKGYKYPQPQQSGNPHRERSMRFHSALMQTHSADADGGGNVNAVDTHKVVRLTVLPPAKGSKINMTTSHGGLLQVESTFQTVDEAQRAYARKIKLQLLNNKRKRKKPVLNKRKVYSSGGFVDSDYDSAVSASTNAGQVAQDNRPDTSTVLAAVGAGMIPATMAMLVPMAMSSGRKRRRRRDLLRRHDGPYGPYFTSSRSSVEVTLPRSL